MIFDLNVAILAAGAGTRMHSTLPKVLHPLLGKPMLQHVIDAAKQLNPQHIYIIYGHEGEQVKQGIAEQDVYWILQEPRLGTGHALQITLPHILKAPNHASKLLIMYGDVPAIQDETLAAMLDKAKENDLVLLNVMMANPFGYGRVARDENDKIISIVEHKDATEEQRQIKEIWSGIILADVNFLAEFLPKLTNDNAQQEYYLTQLIKFAHEAHRNMDAVVIEDEYEVQGVNDREQLIALERELQRRNASKLLKSGVTIKDPNRFDLRGCLAAQHDVVIDINCIIEGKVSIGSGSTIGAHCILKNCHIGKNVTIHPYTFIDGATIEQGAVVGPFARIRPETYIAEEAHIGNFVEIKKSKVGKKSKANHLAYIGDATIGEKVNVGAGTITCNYDGANKHQTIIEDGAFIGSNSSLVAPVTIGANATIGAGSTISKNAPSGELTVARAKQTSIPGWKRSVKHKQ